MPPLQVTPNGAQVYNARTGQMQSVAQAHQTEEIVRPGLDTTATPKPGALNPERNGYGINTANLSRGGVTVPAAYADQLSTTPKPLAPTPAPAPLLIPAANRSPSLLDEIGNAIQGVLDNYSKNGGAMHVPTPSGTGGALEQSLNTGIFGPQPLQSAQRSIQSYFTAHPAQAEAFGMAPMFAIPEGSPGEINALDRLMSTAAKAGVNTFLRINDMSVGREIDNIARSAASGLDRRIPAPSITDRGASIELGANIPGRVAPARPTTFYATYSEDAARTLLEQRQDLTRPPQQTSFRYMTPDAARDAVLRNNFRDTEAVVNEDRFINNGHSSTGKGRIDITSMDEQAARDLIQQRKDIRPSPLHDATNVKVTSPEAARMMLNVNDRITGESVHLDSQFGRVSYPDKTPGDVAKELLSLRSSQDIRHTEKTGETGRNLVDYVLHDFNNDMDPLGIDESGTSTRKPGTQLSRGSLLIKNKIAGSEETASSLSTVERIEASSKYYGSPQEALLDDIVQKFAKRSTRRTPILEENEEPADLNKLVSNNLAGIIDIFTTRNITGQGRIPTENTGNDDTTSIISTINKTDLVDTVTGAGIKVDYGFGTRTHPPKEDYRTGMGLYFDFDNDTGQDELTHIVTDVLSGQKTGQDTRQRQETRQRQDQDLERILDHPASTLFRMDDDAGRLVKPPKPSGDQENILKFLHGGGYNSRQHRNPIATASEVMDLLGFH